MEAKLLIFSSMFYQFLESLKMKKMLFLLLLATPH